MSIAKYFIEEVCMNMFDLPTSILKAEFYDANGDAYYYCGRFLTCDKDKLLPIMTFCDINKIPYHYIYRKFQETTYAIKVFPSNCEVVYQLFTSPYRDKLFIKERKY